MKKSNYDYSKLMWTEIGKYCVNTMGELSVQIPTNAKTKEEKILNGDFKVFKIKKIEFEE